VIRVVVAAASPLERAGLETLLSSSPELSVVGRAGGFADLARTVQELDPEVVVLALETAEEPAVSVVPGPAWVLLTEDLGGPWAGEVLRERGRAILPRSASPAELVAAIQAAAAGLIAVHPDSVEALVAGPRSAPTRQPQSLTPRELGVLEMLAEGVGNKEIAKRLGISEHTVKFHIGSIFGKLGANTRTEAVTQGIRQGYVLI
jgi:two-component system, NarL family, response regulator YdfI